MSAAARLFFGKKRKNADKWAKKIGGKPFAFRRLVQIITDSNLAALTQVVY